MIFEFKTLAQLKDELLNDKYSFLERTKNEYIQCYNVHPRYAMRAALFEYNNKIAHLNIKIKDAVRVENSNPWQIKFKKTKKKGRPKKVCVDHEGREFKSLNDMCDYYHINPQLFCKRKKLGWRLDDCLTTPKGKQGPKR